MRTGSGGRSLGVSAVGRRSRLVGPCLDPDTKVGKGLRVGSSRGPVRWPARPVGPWAYLRDVVLKLSADETDLESLLPDRWATSHPEHVLQHRLDESRRKATRQKAARQERRAIAGPKA